jgi:hypothetical protein
MWEAEIMGPGRITLSWIVLGKGHHYVCQLVTAQGVGTLLLVLHTLIGFLIPLMRWTPGNHNAFIFKHIEAI